MFSVYLIGAIMPQIKRILILGGGFGGINTLKFVQKKFKHDSNIKISIVSQNNYFIYTPMLTHVTSGLLRANDISVPIRKLCKQAEFYHATISSINLKEKLVTITRTFDGKVHALEYDYLVLSLGNVINFFGSENIEKHAFTIKTAEDAMAINHHLINMLESAAQTSDKSFQKKLMTFTVAGASFAGTEMIGEINQFIRDAAKHFYPSIDSENISMNLVASRDFILTGLGETLGRTAGKLLSQVGVDIFTNTKVVDAGEDFVKLDDGTTIPCMTLVWVTGSVIPPVISEIDCIHDKNSKLVVDQYLRLLEHKDVFALGDSALIIDPLTGKPYPPTALHSISESATVAHNLHSTIYDKNDLRPFYFNSPYTMTTLGKKVAVAVLHGMRYSGAIAWILWRIHYLKGLPLFEKKFRVGSSWILDLLFKRDLTFFGTIKTKTLSKVSLESSSSRLSVKDLLKNL